MILTIKTSRLRLRPLAISDSSFIINLLNTPGWLKYIGDRNVHNEEQAHNYLILGPLKSYELHGFGLMMVETKTDHQPIGMCGLLKRDTLEHPDIGFAFLPEFMGNGFAYESAEAVLIQAQQKLNIKSIAAITLPHNINSIRLLEKLGMKRIQSIIMPPNQEELLLYRIDF